MAINPQVLAMLMQSAPMILSALQSKGPSHNIPMDDVAGVPAMLDNGYDVNLLEDTFKNTGSLSDASDSFFESYLPEYKTFPSDRLDNYIDTPQQAMSLDPDKFQNLKLSGLFNTLVSENKNRPAMSSALNMLNKNPKIGIK